MHTTLTRRSTQLPSFVEEIVMSKPSNATYALVAAFSLLMAACQPAEGPVERAGKNVDKAAKKVGDQVDKAADKTRNAVNDAKK